MLPALIDQADFTLADIVIDTVFRLGDLAGDKTRTP